jgi:serine/threonine protein kinase
MFKKIRSSAGMSLLASGGYSDVFFHRDEKVVEKKQAMYSSNEWLSYSTFTDIVIHQSFQSIQGIAHLSQPPRPDYEKQCISMYMPYLGITLNDYVRNIPVKDRLHELTRIMTQVIDICNEMMHQGVLHTDLKPANILVDVKTKDVHVIDFNVIALRKNTSTWNEGIGTWNYAPPEIVQNLQPTNTSLTWTISMMLASLAYRYPYPSKSCKPSSKHLASRRFWYKLQKELSSSHEAHWPVPPDYIDRFPDVWIQLFRDAWHWNPQTRITLKELQYRLDSYHKPRIPQQITWECDPKCLCACIRAKIINWFFRFCKDWDIPYLFSNMVCILDRSGNYIENQYTYHRPEEIATAIIMMMLYMRSEYVFDNTEWLQWFQDHLQVSSEHHPIVQRVLWEIATDRSFQLWQQPIFPMNMQSMLRLKQWFQQRRQRYTLQSLPAEFKTYE